MRAREALDRAGSGSQPAPCRAVGLRENQRDLVARTEQGRQRPLSELGRAGED